MKLYIKNFLLLFNMVFCTQYLNGQNAVLEFESTTYDFGQIKEEDGPVSHQFVFYNKGKDPLTISNVQASCGCTTPFWTKDPIAAGKAGILKASFDPYNRPGVFEKTLTVSSNAEPAVQYLKIKGFVIARTRTIVDDYPDTVGNVRLQSRFLNMGNVTTKSPAIKEFKIYNEGTSSITFGLPYNVPKHIKTEITPKVLSSKATGVIKIIYDAKLKNDYGYLFDNFIIPTSDKKHSKKDLSVVAVVAEDFSELSPQQRLDAPKISVSKSDYDAGEIAIGEKISTTFELINTGRSDLLIKKVKSTCTCITTEVDRSLAKPGEQITLKATFDTSTRKGQEYKNIYIYTNDPLRPETILNLKATLVDK